MKVQGLPKIFFLILTVNFFERFAFYILICTLIFYLTAVFKLSVLHAGLIFSLFYTIFYLSACISTVFIKRIPNHTMTIWKKIKKE